MSEKVDVCIIGGGIVGLFCALELSLAGKTVRIVDKLFTGSSRHNIGDVLFQGYSDEESLPFLKMTSDAWAHTGETYGVDMGFEKRGSIFLAYNEADAVQLKREVAQDKAHGFETVYYEDDIEKLREKMGVKGLPEEIIGGKISEEDYVVDTGIALDALRKLLIQNGVRFWGSDEVVDFQIEENRLVQITTNTGEECEAGEFVITAGVWASKLLKEIGVSVPMRPARCHLLEVSPSGTIPAPLLVKRYRSGDIIVKYQPRSGHVLVSYTGAMDQAQATWSNAVDEEAVEWIKEQLPTMLKGLVGPIVHSVRTVTLAITQDGRPFIGKVGKFENVTVAIGFCGKSYAYSAGVSKAVKSVVTGEEPDMDMSIYQVGRKIEFNPHQDDEMTTIIGGRSGEDDEMTTIIGGKGGEDDEMTTVIGGLPDADGESSMETGDKPEGDGDIIMEVGDLPSGESDVTMEVGDLPAGESGITMEVGDLPEGDGDITMEVDGDSALKNKKEGGSSFVTEGEEGSALGKDGEPKTRLEVEGESALKNKKEGGSSFVTEGEEGSALGKDSEPKTRLEVEGGSALGQKEDNDSNFVSEGEGSALGKHDEDDVTLEFEGESGLTKEKEEKKKSTLVVEGEEKTALGSKPKPPKQAKGKLEVDDNPYLGLGAKKKPPKEELEEEEQEEMAALAEGEELQVEEEKPVETSEDPVAEKVAKEDEKEKEDSTEEEEKPAEEPKKKKESKLVYEERKPKKSTQKIVYD